MNSVTERRKKPYLYVNEQGNSQNGQLTLDLLQVRVVKEGNAFYEPFIHETYLCLTL